MTQTRPDGEMALVVSRVRIDDPDRDLEYWLGRTPLERIAAVEVMRRRVYGYDDASGSRLQRVCRTVRRT